MATPPSIALPGQTLGAAARVAPGDGTHLHGNDICASVAGVVVVQQQQQQQQRHVAGGAIKAALPTISVTRLFPSLSSGQQQQQQQQQATAGPANALPAVGSIVLARVTRTTARQATLSILAVDGRPCGGAVAGGGETQSGGDGAGLFAGVVRAQDVRATEKDRVRILDSFRPGDLVRAVVLGLGDQQHYHLGTAANELGVVAARHAASGRAMAPASWREFRDPATGQAEPRKVAKPN